MNSSATNWRRRVKWLAGLIGLVMSAWLISMWAEWLPPITEQQQAALQMMRAGNQDAVGQRNAWSLFWLLPYEIPAAERADVLKRDIAELNALSAEPDDETGFESSAEGRYPRRWAKQAPAHRFCADDGDCLAQVRADRAAAAAELAGAEAELRALRELGDYDHLAIPHRVSHASPIPPFGRAFALQLLDAALRFEAGEIDIALAGLCSDSLAWRRLKGKADNLIFEMVNIRVQQRALNLYAAMRAELPAEHGVPAVCRQAFAAPSDDERQSCDVFRLEFQLQERLFEPGGFEAFHASDSDGQWLRTIGTELLINQEATLALGAERLAQTCAAIQLPSAEMRADRRVESAGCALLGRIFNPMGCVLADVAAPDYQTYLLRDRDWQGRLQAFQVAEWLATQADPTSAWAARPANMRQIEQALTLSAGVLNMQLLRPFGRQPPDWQLPLPASRVAARTAPSAH
ncbi:hypothetical protein [Pseudomarimonas arenosa]|uniref:Uncharacterized protein n=1 Tax=Pseudomarimonas arenosa TaxID=2774145 RepID=A0AAW3ZMR7_9GAMM|nr:hypothetical protein [Pseudomarimonas arenosa]MBD8527263.1 hypothetical protein [Pseudomarimonas arenosa]